MRVVTARALSQALGSRCSPRTAGFELLPHLDEEHRLSPRMEFSPWRRVPRELLWRQYWLKCPYLQPLPPALLGAVLVPLYPQLSSALVRETDSLKNPKVFLLFFGQWITCHFSTFSLFSDITSENNGCIHCFLFLDAIVFPLSHKLKLYMQKYFLTVAKCSFEMSSAHFLI